MGGLGSRPREDIGLRPLNQPKWFLAHSGHWYHPANQVPAHLRQFHTWTQTRAYGHRAALNPWSSVLAFRSKPHYHSVSTQRERQWAHPGPPNLPWLSVKVPDPPLSPNGPASPRDFKFVNKNHCCGYLILSALSPVCRLGRSGFQLEVWGLGVGEMGKKWKTARGSFSLGKAFLPPAGLRSTQLSSGLLLPWGLLDVSQVLSDPVPRDPHQCQFRKSLLEVPRAG